MIFGNFEFGSSLVGSGGSAFDWYIPSSSSSNGSKKCQLTVVPLIGIFCKKYGAIVKGSSEPNHFIFEINIAKSRIRHRTTLKFNF